MRVFCHVCETAHEREGGFYSSPLTHTIDEDGVKTNLVVAACKHCQKIPGATRKAFDRWSAGYRPSVEIDADTREWCDHWGRKWFNDHIKVIKVDVPAPSLSVSEVIGKAHDLYCESDEAVLDFHAAALALGATESDAENLNTLACTAVVRARGGI